MDNTHKTHIFRYIITLMLPILACGAPVSFAGGNFPVPQSAPTPLVADTTVEMVVIADMLNIRAEADYNSTADPLGLRKGEKVKVYLTCTGGEMREWLALDADCTRWVKASWLRAK